MGGDLINYLTQIASDDLKITGSFPGVINERLFSNVSCIAGYQEFKVHNLQNCTSAGF